MQEITHIACSDESNWNTGRFRSIGLVTASAEHFDMLSKKILTLLEGSGVKEFKWKNLKQARERFAAQKLLDFALNHCCRGCLRVDAMVWDIEDSRHAVQGRDDEENLQRMYYHLFKNVLRERWPDNSSWVLYPDEHTGLNWASVKDFLGYADTTTDVIREPLFSGSFKLRLKKEFSIQDILEASAGEPPLVQLADLFAGMASYSREAYNRYCDWHKANAPQRGLFKEEEPQTFSNAEKERFQVLHEFDCGCKKRKIGVSLKTFGGLRTRDPNYPINFWWYEPQHQLDKAPTRQ